MSFPFSIWPLVFSRRAAHGEDPGDEVGMTSHQRLVIVLLQIFCLVVVFATFKTFISADEFLLLNSQLNVHGNPETELHKKQQNNTITL